MAGDVAFLNWGMLGYSGVSASGRATMMVGETSSSLTRTDLMVESGQAETRELVMVSL